ncbi:MAG: tRNA pseudouridine(13) synthase TruD [Candidatus Wenzhouxiangella sp. M2_3B_020]
MPAHVAHPAQNRAGDPHIRARCSARDLHPIGPLDGEGDSGVFGEAAALERDVVAGQQELADGLAKFRLEADRRALRMRVLDLEWTFEDDDALVLMFELRTSCYATTVLREVVEYADASHDTRSS